MKKKSQACLLLKLGMDYGMQRRVIVLFSIVIFILIVILNINHFFNQRQQETQQNKYAAINLSRPSPSTQEMPVGDIPGWHQIFTDDFTTDVPLGSFPDAVSDKWSDYPDGWPD